MDELAHTLMTTRKIKSDQAKGMTREQLYKKYTEFAANKPKTFNQTVDGNFDEEMFLKICGIYSSNTDKLQGTIAVGEMLAEKFLYPTTGTPSDEDRQRGLDIMNKKMK
jgi:hypothetical protein